MIFYIEMFSVQDEVVAVTLDPDEVKDDSKIEKTVMGGVPIGENAPKAFLGKVN